MKELFTKGDIPVCINRIGSMFTVFFTPHPVFDFSSALRSDTKRFGSFFREMLANQIYMAPSQFETSFVSFAHTDEDIEKTLAACKRALYRI